MNKGDSKFQVGQTYNYVNPFGFEFQVKVKSRSVTRAGNHWMVIELTPAFAFKTKKVRIYPGNITFDSNAHGEFFELKIDDKSFYCDANNELAID